MNELSHKPNLTWVDKMNEFYNKSTKPWLKNAKIDAELNPTTLPLLLLQNYKIPHTARFIDKSQYDTDKQNT